MTGRGRREVELFMRVGEGPEVCVGRARRFEDVPVLLREIADRWLDGWEPEPSRDGGVSGP